jgi:hypothetical protein
MLCYRNIRGEKIHSTFLSRFDDMLGMSLLHSRLATDMRLLYSNVGLLNNRSQELQEAGSVLELDAEG